MDLVLGLFKLSKMEEDMDKIVSCVQVIFHNNLDDDDFDADADIDTNTYTDADTDRNTVLGYPELNRWGRRRGDFSRRVCQQCDEEQISHQHAYNHKVDKN